MSDDLHYWQGGVFTKPPLSAFKPFIYRHLHDWAILDKKLFLLLFWPVQPKLLPTDGVCRRRLFPMTIYKANDCEKYLNEQ